MQEASRLASSLYSSGSCLSRSASSVGERHSQTFSLPLLPKRAETFSGFDQSCANPSDQTDNNSTDQADASYAPPIIKEIDLLASANCGEQQFGETELLATNNHLSRKAQNTQHPLHSMGLDDSSSSQGNHLQASAMGINNSTSILPPPLLSLDPIQQQAAFQMTHYLNSLMCMVSEHFTSLESLKAEVSEMKEKSRLSGGRYIQNQQLEELRNLQEQLTKDRQAWTSEKEAIEDRIKEEQESMLKRKEELAVFEKDIDDQRQALYKKLNALRSQGIEIGTNQNIMKDTNVGLVPTNAPHHPLHASESIQTAAGGASGPSTDIHFFHSDHSSPDGLLAPGGTGAPSIVMDKTGGSATVGVRKTSSMSGVSSGNLVAQASSVATGGSLKKDSFAANLHLMSAANEAKQSVVGLEKQEIQQKIPEKLVSKLSVSTRGSVSSSRLGSVSGAERMSKKNLVGLSSNSGVSPSGERGSNVNSAAVGNLVPKPETVAQLLPFKLSESSSKDAASQHLQQQQYTSMAAGHHGSSHLHTPQQGSPGRQKLSSSSFGDSSSSSKLSQLSQAHHPPQYYQQHQPTPSSTYYPYVQNQHNVVPAAGDVQGMSAALRHRTGSSPHLPGSNLVPTNSNTSFGAGSSTYNYKHRPQAAQLQQLHHQQQQQQPRNNSNTLPKKDGKQKEIAKVNYSGSRTNDVRGGGSGDGRSGSGSGGSNEDKVIYF